MYARCPDCQITLHLTAGELAQAGGVVTCGDCHKVFNALKYLFEYPPAPGEAPIEGEDGAAGMPPFLQPMLELTAENEDDAAPSGLEPDQADLEQEQIELVAEPEVAHVDPAVEIELQKLGGQRRSAQLPRYVWALLAAALFIGVGYQGWQLWQYRAHWVEVERLASQSREPEAFRIISRDVHTHPSAHNAQLVSLRMLNTAGYPQAYPILEVSLLDTTQNVVATRRFLADEYLPPGTDPLRLVEANEDFPLVLQLSTPIGGHGGMTFKVL